MSNLIQGHKVVTAEEMVRIEKLAYAKGDSELAFMENAGMGIAEETEEFCFANDLGKEVILLVGKGNNGGDAFAAGKRLLAKGFSVRAIQIYPFEISSLLCQKQGEAFKKAGGKIHFVKESAPFPELHEGVILDGLVGTGFKGKPDAPLARAIQKANQSHLPILAVDIPSGVNGNTGEVQTCAIHALRTIYLGLPKVGFFIGEGWNHVGELTRVDFGLKESYIQRAKAEAYLINEEAVPTLLPPVVRNRHKYQAGYLLAVAGSPGMSGAAFLSTLAALRSGAGIVRLFHTASFRAELARAPLELVKEELKGSSLARIFEESKRAKSLLIGPGMGRTPDSKEKDQRAFRKKRSFNTCRC